MLLDEKVLKELQSAGFDFDRDTGYPKASVHEKFKLSSKLARIYMKHKHLLPADVLLYDEMADLHRLSHKKGLEFHHTATKDIFIYYTSNTAKEVLGYTRKQYEASISRLESVGLIKRIGNGDKNATMFTLPMEQTIKAKREEVFCGIKVPSDIVLPAGNLIILLEALNKYASEKVTVPKHHEELQQEVKAQILVSVPEELHEVVIEEVTAKLENISRPIRMKENYSTVLIKETLKQYEDSLISEKVETPTSQDSDSITQITPQKQTIEELLNSYSFKPYEKLTLKTEEKDIFDSGYILSEEEAKAIPF